MKSYGQCTAPQDVLRQVVTSKSRQYGAHAFLLIPKSLSTYGCVWSLRLLSHNIYAFDGLDEWSVVLILAGWLVFI